MKRVLVIHSGCVPHYRVPVYSYLEGYLKEYGFELRVVSDAIQEGDCGKPGTWFQKMCLSTLSIARFVSAHKVDIVVDFMGLRDPFLFSTYFIVKGLLGRKMIYWGQGRDLLHKNAKLKNAAYRFEQSMADAIILYAEHLAKYVNPRHRGKVFVANNTLLIDYRGLSPEKTRRGVLEEHGIHTRKNIICVGRMQHRKRIGNLVEAFALLKRPDIGLILVGPDPDGVLKGITCQNIFKLGPVYGKEKLDLLSSSDVYCLPGAIGLSIVDAFHCGLPFITEEGDESAESMYLKDGLNGFIVERGDTLAMSRKLRLLLDDDELRRQFSAAAKEEIARNGTIDGFCRGFHNALSYVAEVRDPVR